MSDPLTVYSPVALGSSAMLFARSNAPASPTFTPPAEPFSSLTCAVQQNQRSGPPAAPSPVRRASRKAIWERGECQPDGGQGCRRSARSDGSMRTSK